MTNYLDPYNLEEAMREIRYLRKQVRNLKDGNTRIEEKYESLYRTIYDFVGRDFCHLEPQLALEMHMAEIIKSTNMELVKLRKAQDSPNYSLGEPVAKLEELLGQYWDLAYYEGCHGYGRGDEANAVLHQLRMLYTSAPTIPEGYLLVAEACREFVRKVECGEARSSRSYKQMKAALTMLEDAPKQKEPE